MADLYAIYQELGLSGLVPHATRPMSKARTMLITKIREGEALYYLHSPVTNAPFIYVMDRARQALFFTNEVQANAEAEKLNMQQYMVVPVKLISGDKTTEDVLMGMYNAGIDAINLDQSITLPLSQFIDIPRYDGYPNEEFVLKNHKLNGAINYYMQIVQAQMSNLDAEYFFARALCSSYVLLPVNPEMMEAENVLDTFVLLNTDKSNVPMVAAFTDWDQLSMSDFPPAAIVVAFEELAELIKNETLTVALNPAGVALNLRSRYIDYLFNIAQSPSASHIPLVSSLCRPQDHNPDEDWTMMDFVPDFLR